MSRIFLKNNVSGGEYLQRSVWDVSGRHSLVGQPITACRVWGRDFLKTEEPDRELDCETSCTLTQPSLSWSIFWKSPVHLEHGETPGWRFKFGEVSRLANESSLTWSYSKSSSSRPWGPRIETAAEVWRTSERGAKRARLTWWCSSGRPWNKTQWKALYLFYGLHTRWRRCWGEPSAASCHLRRMVFNYLSTKKHLYGCFSICCFVFDTVFLIIINTEKLNDVSWTTIRLLCQCF